ncbi:hypothetical protein [Streptomyces achromogenes]
MPAILNAVVLPELDAFHLAEAAAQADRPDAFPDGTITAGVIAALVLCRA